jgi:hypothetical protein
MAQDELPELHPPALEPWRAAALAARARLLAQDGLSTRLRKFVSQKS